MKHLGITFPTSAEAAVRNAAEDRGLSAGERFTRLLSLIRTVEGIFGERPDREQQLALRNRRKDEEIEAIIRAQILGHV